VKVRRLRGALGAASHRNTEGACREITRAICESLRVAIPTVRVHEVRPTGDYGELHGLYTRWDDGRARIEVWMRTAVNEQPVAFRTFLRTLAHEIGHHLDYVHLALADSFHTEGFFSRESSLVKQLLAAVPPASSTRRAARDLPPPGESSSQKMLRLRARLGMTTPVEPEERSAENVTAPEASGTPQRGTQLSLRFVSETAPELREA
jgi:hypothetical protein